MSNKEGLVTISNGGVEVVIDPDRGGEVIWIGRPGGVNALSHEKWVSPLPSSVGHRYQSDEDNWLGGYRGGWQFLFPNSGAAGFMDGVELGFHGESSRAPTVLAELTSSSCKISTGARLPLELIRTITVGDAGVVSVSETVTNVGADPCSFIWGHHPVFPIHDSTVVDAPGATVFAEPTKASGISSDVPLAWPIVDVAGGDEVDLSLPPEIGQERLLYLPDLKPGWAAVRHPGSNTPGVAIAWSTEAFPHLWIWSQRGGGGFPFFGRAHMLGLEPQRAWPFDGITGAIERGQAITLFPKESIDSWLTLTLIKNEKEVVGMSREGFVDHA